MRTSGPQDALTERSIELAEAVQGEQLSRLSMLGRLRREFPESEESALISAMIDALGESEVEARHGTR